jgi:hypothetical protein
MSALRLYKPIFWLVIIISPVLLHATDHRIDSLQQYAKNDPYSSLAFS